MQYPPIHSLTTLNKGKPPNRAGPSSGGSTSSSTFPLSSGTTPHQQRMAPNDRTPSSRLRSSPNHAMDADIDVDALEGYRSDSKVSKVSSRLRVAVREGGKQGSAALAHHQGSSSNGSSSSSSAPNNNNRDGAGVGVVDELAGFSNIGNTCFMNSTLQCLLRTQRLRKFLLASDLERVAPRPPPLTSTLQDICRRMFTSSGAHGGGSAGGLSTSSSFYGSSFASLSKSIAPSNFKNCLASYRRAFAGSEQHDAHEFLRFTLDGVHDECNSITKKPPYEELKDVEHEEIRDTAARWLQNHVKRNWSIVQEAFCGQFASETVCSACQYRSVSCETFLDLSVPVPRSGFAATGASTRGGSITGSESEFCMSRALQHSSSFHAQPSGKNGIVTLHHALEEFFAPVHLTGTDAYHCPKCKKPQDARRSVHLFQAPDVLVIHLKRFRHSRFHATKINDLVKFPVDDELSIASFMHPQAHRSGDPPTYQLSGVVHHMGSVHSGHYIAHCRCSQRGATRWYEFNDASVDAVSGPADTIVSPSAYVLFYEKVAAGASKL